MNRRDFLTLSTRGKSRILELSCERLYMRYVDARAGIGRRLEDSGKIDAELPSWTGEPPTQIDIPTTATLFEELERELADADVLRVRGHDWLADEEFGREVEARVEAFRCRGGHVKSSDPTTRLVTAGRKSG